MEEILEILNTHAMAIATFAVSVASLSISLLAHQRDAGRIDFIAYSGEIRNGTTLKLEERGLILNMVNSGRRPIVPISIGGDINGTALKRLVAKILAHRTPIWIKPRAFFLDSSVVTKAFKPNGESRALLEGQYINLYLPDPGGIGIIESITNCENFYVADSTGKKHKIPRSAMAKLKADCKERKSAKKLKS